MTLHGIGSIKFNVLVMQINAGSATQVILRMTKNSKYKQVTVNSKEHLAEFVLLCSVMHIDRL